MANIDETAFSNEVANQEKVMEAEIITNSAFTPSADSVDTSKIDITKFVTDKFVLLANTVKTSADLKRWIAQLFRLLAYTKRLTVITQKMRLDFKKSCTAAGAIIGNTAALSDSLSKTLLKGITEESLNRKDVQQAYINCLMLLFKREFENSIGIIAFNHARLLKSSDSTVNVKAVAANERLLLGAPAPRKPLLAPKM